MKNTDIIQALDDAWDALDEKSYDILDGNGSAEDIKSVRDSRDVIEALRTAVTDPSTMSFIFAQVERSKERADRIREIDATVVD